MDGQVPLHPVMAAGQPADIPLPDDDQGNDSRSSSSNSPTRADYEESDFFMAHNDSQSSLGGVPADASVEMHYDRTSPAECLPAEILLGIFQKLSSPQDLMNCMLTSKEWARCAVNILWWRPACSSWERHEKICRTLSTPNTMFAYKDFVKRLNLTQLADRVNDGSIMPLSVCSNVERLTLTNCHPGLTDTGLMSLLLENRRLLALDVSVMLKNDGQPEKETLISEASIEVLAARCHQLQGLNISGCLKVTNEALVKVAQSCRKIKRVGCPSDHVSVGY